MPLDLDFLTRVVNVHWGGGIYVTGSQWFYTNPASVVWTNEIDDTENLTDWSKTISTPHGGGFMPSAFPGSGVCALVGPTDNKAPMFVLGGLQDNIEEGGPPGAAMMMTSNDGVSWSPQTFVSSGDVYLLTWDEDKQAFYAGMWDYSQLLDPESDRILIEIALRSTDGLHWTEVGRQSGDTSSARISPIEQYCSDKVIDVHGYKVPTSIFGYDEENDILITPDPVSMSFGTGYPAGEEIAHGHKLKIIRGPENDHPGTATKALPAGMDRVWAVAYAAGIWQAAGQTSTFPGHGVVATSIDDGQSWTITLTDVAGSAFTNMAAVDQTVSSE